MASERFQRRIDRLLDLIEEAADQRDWQKVHQLAEDILMADPSNADAKSFLATAERASPGVSGTSESPVPPAATPTIVAPSDQPTSFSGGRYQVKRFLGEGGKKKVYLATDTLLDRDVAFALIKTEGLDDVSRTRITREAQAMGRLGSHPHIVTVFDLGEEVGQPFMVTELMGGGDVEGVVEDAPDHKLALDQAINITRETCRGLEFAHSRGIVHRDLKPGDVWLTGDGIAKIGDFGLAVAIDRSRLTTEGMMVGTVSYMPPEQAMGGAVTPRSDLYSLGAMLYEMITGRPPFLGDDSVAIIGQHINTPPVAPTWHNSECPRALEALIMRLLAKDPAERPESASDVLAALEGIDLTIFVETSQPDEAHALDSLAGGVFVGRQREMGELKACLEDALSGRGRLVTLVGEPGIGKTRTAQELATYAGLRSAQVLWGRCYEEQGVPPYWPWVQAIRSYVRERDPDQLRSEMGAGAPDIAEVVSDVKERLPDLSLPPQLDSPEQARFRLFDSITSFLKSASQKQPLVLVLDDLHWADQPSLLLLQFVARELGGSRLLLVGTYRDMELSRQHPLAETLGELTRERLFQRVLLRGLSRLDVTRFIEIAAGVEPPAGLAEAVHTQTEGNPLFVTEVVRLLVQEGELTQESGARDSWTVRIPEGVREVIGRRLNRLSQRCNETLTIASVIGREFALVQINPLIDELTEDRLLEVLEEALSARVIEELPQAVGRYQFTHALIQETLTEELTLTRRVRLHARIAEALEELYGDNAEAHAAELAYHFAEAEAVLGTEKLVHYSLLAGERALAAYAYEEALEHFERTRSARQGQPMDDEFAELLFGLGRAQAGALGRNERQQAVDNVGLAFDYYFEARNVSKAIDIASYPLVTAGSRYQGVTQMLGRALPLVPPDSHQSARLLSRYGYFVGVTAANLEDARDAFNRALAIAKREGDQGLEMEILSEAGAVHGQHLHFEESLEYCLRSIKLAQFATGPSAEYLATYWAFYAYMAVGDVENAREKISACLITAERGRRRNDQLIALWGNIYLESAQGNWQGVRDYIQRCHALSPNDRNTQYHSLLLAYETGDTGQSEADLTWLVGPAPEYGESHGYIVLTLASVAWITGDTGHLDTAKARAETLLASSYTPQQSMLARAGMALIEVIQGDTEAASEQYTAMEPWRGLMLSRLAFNTDRVLGLLANTIGEPVKAKEHFEDALTFCRKAGYRPELAWTC